MALIDCPACGRECSSQAFQCPHCGHPILQQQQSQPPYQQQPQRPYEAPPKTWLLESILATILCCLLGVVGIVYAAKVENLWYQGRTAEAYEAARTAKTWTLVAFFIGLGSVLIYFMMIALGVITGLSDIYGF